MAEEALRPTRGGFTGQFGTAKFVREFLAGNGPEGSPRIDPQRGAPQTDIHGAYKVALHTAFAENMVEGEVDERFRRHLPPLTIEEANTLLQRFLEGIPSRLTRGRYHSFVTYFHRFKQLGWVEQVSTEPSEIQEIWPEGPPRVYYRLTAAGRRATEVELSDPIMTIYNYPREIRSPKRRKYIRVPVGRRRRVTVKPPPPEPPPPEPPPPVKPPPVKIPPFELPERPGRGAAQQLIRHLREMDKLDPEAPEVHDELDRLNGDLQKWLTLVEEAVAREEEKDEPDEDRLERLQERQQALEEVGSALEDKEIGDAIAALERAFPPRRGGGA